MPVNAQKMQSIAYIKQILQVKAIFYALADAIIHMFFYQSEGEWYLSCFIIRYIS